MTGKGEWSGLFSSPSKFLSSRDGVSRFYSLYYYSGPHQDLKISEVRKDRDASCFLDAAPAFVDKTAPVIRPGASDTAVVKRLRGTGAKRGHSPDAWPYPPL